MAKSRDWQMKKEEEFPGSNYSDEEREVLVAVDRFKQKHRRLFPAVTELIGIMRELGWRKHTPNAEAQTTEAAR